LHRRVGERPIDARPDRGARIEIEPVDGRMVERDDGNGAVDLVAGGDGLSL